jgi:FkbM family methyltransferase
VTEQSGWAPILGRCEPEAQALYARLVAAGETAWDLGANTGIHTLLLSRLVGPAGRVVAFEPLEVNAAEIAQTCALNGVGNVSIARTAISDVPGRAAFMTGRHAKQGSIVGIGSGSGEVVEVECETMDDALRSHPEPAFVKVDIEGAESRALRGFSQAARIRPSLAIDLHTPSEDVAVGRWLAEQGYRVYRLLDPTARQGKSNGNGLVTPVRRMDEGWPSPTGIWGTVVAVHPNRTEKLRILEALCEAAR